MRERDIRHRLEAAVLLDELRRIRHRLGPDSKREVCTLPPTGDNLDKTETGPPCGPVSGTSGRSGGLGLPPPLFDVPGKADVRGIVLHPGHSRLPDERVRTRIERAPRHVVRHERIRLREELPPLLGVEFAVTRLHEPRRLAVAVVEVVL